MARLQFRVNDLPIDGDLEGSAARRHQLKRANVLLELQEFLRQTDGVRLVVSSGAVLDANFDTHDFNNLLVT